MSTRFIPYIMFVVFFFHSWQLLSQGVEVAQSSFKSRQVIPPSPDAAALGKYGNVPVSLFSGSVNISVPINEIKGIFLTLPISLSYNASGFKPEEIAPWTGLGWSLNAGGVITRAVIGNPDTEGNYFGSSSPLVVPAANDLQRIRYMQSIYDGSIETQPDVYYYNFMGRTGRFFLRPDKTVLKKEDDMLSISYVNGNFTIRDEQGITYIFNDKELTNTIPNDEAGAPSYHWYNFTSSWYMSEVQAVGGNERLTFSYYKPVAKQSIYENALKNQSAIYSYRTSACSAVTPISSNENSYSTPPTTQISRRFVASASLMKGSTVLKTVEFGSVTDVRQDLWLADFAGERRLDTIKSYSFLNGIRTLVSYHRLFYSYFPTNNVGQGDLSLRLDSVKEMSIDGSTPDKPAYRFQYDNSALPIRYTSKIDHWGYYNSNGQNSLIPNFKAEIDGTEKTYGLGANRNPSFYRGKAAILEKMVYPTGGSTKFTYEAHSDNVGGVRIASIEDYSFDNVLVKRKNYDYSGAISGQPPVYGRVTKRTDYADGCFQVCNSSMSMWCLNSYTSTLTISTNSIFGLGSVAGSPIGYTSATETVIDGQNRQLGKTVYGYFGSIAGRYDESIRAGVLQQLKIYDNGNKLLQETTYEYSFVSGDFLDVVIAEPESFQSNENIACLESSGSYTYITYLRSTTGHTCLDMESVPIKFRVQTYALTNQRKLLTKQTEKQFDQISNNYIVYSKEFFYGTAHNSPIRIEQTNSSTNEELVTEIKYTSDYNYSGILAGDAQNHSFAVNNNLKTLEVEKSQYRQNADGINKRYLNGTITTYDSRGLPIRIYRLELSTPVSALTSSSVSGGSLTFSNLYKQLGEYVYNSYGNLIEQNKTGDISTAYVWDYDNLYPVASVTNARNSAICFTGFETGESGGWSLSSTAINTSTAFNGLRSCNLSSSSQISRNLPAATTVSYYVSYWTKGGAATVSTNAGAVASSQQGSSVNGWYYYQHLIPAGLTNVILSSPSAIIDDIRLYPKESLMTNYSYLPDVGVTNQTDPNNLTTRYEYDGLRRLVNVKDREDNIIQNYKYNYGLGSPITIPQKLFYSQYYEQSYSKQGCPVNTYPTSHLYSVSLGRFAALDQNTANTLALAELASKGQQQANEIGICNYYSAEMTTHAWKNNCKSWQGTGSRVLYVSPLGAYKSPISQAIADQMALDNLASNAQAYANGAGTCSCEGIDRRFVNGICEFGQRINSGWSYEGALGYKCYYFYRFTDNYQTPTQFEYVSSAGQCVSQ